MNLALVIIAVLGAGPDVAKLPIPDMVEQASAKRLIDDVYGKKLKAAKTPDTKRTLAQELLEIGKKEPNAGNKHACFSTAKSLAAEIHDGSLGLEVVQVLSAQFQAEPGQDRDALIREAERLWEVAEKKRGTDQLASRLDAVELWLRSGADSPLLAKNWEERITGLRSDGTIVLHAKDAKTIGSRIAYSNHHDAVHAWTDPSEYIEWQATALEAGAYDVFLEYAADGNMAFGSAYAVGLFRLGASRPSSVISFTLQNTGDWPTFTMLRIGKLVVRSDGSFAIRLYVTRKVAREPQMGLIDPRSLQLRRH